MYRTNERGVSTTAVVKRTLWHLKVQLGSVKQENEKWYVQKVSGNWEVERERWQVGKCKVQGGKWKSEKC